MKFLKWLFGLGPVPQVGEVWRLDNDSDNPFAEKCLAKIVDVKDGYLFYKTLIEGEAIGNGRSKKIKDFTLIYSKEE